MMTNQYKELFNALKFGSVSRAIQLCKLFDLNLTVTSYNNMTGIEYAFLHVKSLPNIIKLLAYIEDEEMQRDGDLMYKYVNYEFNQEGHSLIHIASINNRLDILQDLYNKGFDLNAPTADGRTNMELMIDMDNQKVVRFLLKRAIGLEGVVTYQ